jgi:hypothetical protein
MNPDLAMVFLELLLQPDSLILLGSPELARLLVMSSDTARQKSCTVELLCLPL